MDQIHLQHTFLYNQDCMINELILMCDYRYFLNLQ